MKILNSIVKTIAALCIMGALFFSCSTNDADKNGTLVIKLPGSDSARAVSSEDFTTLKSTLKYRIVCSNGTEEVRRDARSGSVSMSLLSGRWTVTLTVLNAAYQDIGSDTKTVVIEGGKTTTVPMSVSVDTSGNDITYFAIRDENGSLTVGDIEEHEVKGQTGDYKITVYVNKQPTNNMYPVEVTHTGVSIDPSPESHTLVDFNSPPRIFTVKAANGKTKAYKVRVIFADDSPYLGSGLTLSGQVYGGQSNKNNPNIAYEHNAHVYLKNSNPSTDEDNWDIATGILSGFSIDTNALTLASLQNEWKKIDSIYDIKLNSSNVVQSASLNLRALSKDGNYYTLSKKRAYTYRLKTVNESVCYLYVKSNVNVTALGKKFTKDGIAITTKDLNLELKLGWNAIYTKEEINEDNKTGTIEISLRNPALKWTLDFLHR